ncbi:MOSC domain-containing protein [Asaia spathodeae]|uniref:MOSC domain-containing protein n=1 Tax=Asaia spathodeae TaxID=657016 RepID=UPI002FC2E2E1
MTRIAALYIHPVKSLHRIDVAALDLEPWGPRGDRRWLVVSPEGKFMTQRQYPAMARIITALEGENLHLSGGTAEPLMLVPPGPDSPLALVSVWKDRDIEARDAGDTAAEWVSTFLETPCRLVYIAAPERARPAEFGSVSFADGFPLLVTNTASLTDLNERLDQPVPMERFRPNIVVESETPWAEDTWRILKIGSVELELVKPCSRCIVTTIDQETGTIPVARKPLRTMTGFRHQPGGVMFGQNAIIRRGGAIRLGDRIDCLA